MSDARDLVAFLAASPSPFHAVAEVKRRLVAAGFRELDERSSWDLRPSDSAFVVRADASIIAFVQGEPEHAGFRVIGAHTDSPNLRLKPNPAQTREGYASLGVEVYGGVLLHTWLDRDLGVAGRVVLDDLSRHMVRLDEPVARVPSLAIHLDRDVNDKGLVLNKQQHLVPVLALGDGEQAYARLLTRLGVDPTRVRGFDLGLFDRTPPTLGGEDEAFVFSGRLDNLASCHAALSALLASKGDTKATRVIALFDHEEVGSSSAHGAAGPFLEDVLRRLCGGGAPDGFARAIAASFCVSADMAHAVHPNYADRHEPKHMPRMGKGPVVKANVQQRYATDGLSAARFKRACARAGVGVQDFVTRTDLACGTTIGPITATRLGLATVDVGNPMLSMHSSREMCSAADVAPMIAALGAVLVD